MNKKQIAAALVMAVGISSISAVNVSAVSSGWKAQGSQWYYYNSNGTMKTGWLYDGGSWYYLKSSGEMAKGWCSVDNTWYYFNNDGSMKTGWLSDGGSWYYLKNSGAMATRWMQVDGTWYYFSDNGSMKSNGWLRLTPNGEAIAEGSYFVEGEVRYYLNSDGSMKTGWLKDGEDWYYFKSSGEKNIRWQYINNKWYYFDDNGKMVTGWSLTGDYIPGNMGNTFYDPNYYYFSKNGDWIEDTKNFYKVKTEKEVYDVDTKEIKFTVTNNSDSNYWMHPEYSIQVFKDDRWQDVSIRQGVIKDLIDVQSNSEKEYSLDVNCLLGGQLEAGKYRIEQGDGGELVYSEFQVINEKSTPDVTIKMDKDLYYIDYYDNSENGIKYSITNNSDKDISFGLEYKIQILVDGKWKDVPLKSNEFNEIAVLVKSKGTYESSIPMDNIKSYKYGEEEEDLDPGTYRIVKKINGQDVYAEFNVDYEIQY